MYEGPKKSRKERRREQTASMLNWECGRKAKFPTKEAAMKVINGKTYSSEVRPYHCTWGDHWHIGGKFRKSFKKKEARKFAG